MRHGRKSRTKRFNGYKRHIATDLDSGLILSGAITPANHPEDEAAAGLTGDIAKQGLEIGTLYIDRGYVKADLVDDVLGRGGEVVCRLGRAEQGSLLQGRLQDQRARSHDHLSGRRGGAHRVRLRDRVRPGSRARLRERVGVEHRLAHLVRRQGRRARYRGVRRNLFDLRRASAIQNLEAIERKMA
jgi:hypothetical protein